MEGGTAAAVTPVMTPLRTPVVTHVFSVTSVPPWCTPHFLRPNPQPLQRRQARKLLMPGRFGFRLRVAEPKASPMVPPTGSPETSRLPRKSWRALIRAAAIAVNSLFSHPRSISVWGLPGTGLFRSSQLSAECRRGRAASPSFAPGVTNMPPTAAPRADRLYFATFTPTPGCHPPGIRPGRGGNAGAPATAFHHLVRRPRRRRRRVGDRPVRHHPGRRLALPSPATPS